MRIGILTFARVANFGANLQGISTFNSLKKLGHDPVFIDWIPDDYMPRLERELGTPQASCQINAFDAACARTRRCADDDDIRGVIRDEGIEAVVVGSDAVLQHHPLASRIHLSRRSLLFVHRMDSTRLFPNPFWGTFNDGLPSRAPFVIMSASSQNAPFRLFTPGVCREMARLVGGASLVSVRDDWTRSMIRHVTSGRIDPEVTPDPVFAFGDNCPELVMSKSEVMERFELPEDYLLVCFRSDKVVPPGWIQGLQAGAEKRGWACTALPMPNGIRFQHKFPHAITGPINAFEWYSLIKHARGYVGQNMHPVVVSLHNAVPVYSFDHYGVTLLLKSIALDSSSKIHHVMKAFGCEGNRTSVAGRWSSIPTPAEVLVKLDHFDTGACREISAKFSARHAAMMDRIDAVLRASRRNDGAASAGA